MPEGRLDQPTSVRGIVSEKLSKTIFGEPLSPESLQNYANRVGASIKQVDSGTKLTLADGDSFLISAGGRLLSEHTPVPAKDVVYKGKPAGYRWGYVYPDSPGEPVIVIKSYVTTDGEVFPDTRHELQPKT